jgi:hypothetical protein
MSEQIAYVVNGRRRLLGIWRHGSSGQYGELRKLAMAGLRALEGFDLKASNILADARRSELAKREDVAEAAKERLAELGQVQQRLNEHAAALAVERAKLTAITPYRDGDHATVAIDLALAEQLRNMDDSKRNVLLMSGNDQRLLDAALRLPIVLTGISPAFYSRMERAAIERKHPAEAYRAEALAESVEDAQTALRRAFKILAESSGTPLEDQVEAAGEHYQQLAVTEGNRIAAEAIHRRQEAEKDAEEEAEE